MSEPLDPHATDRLAERAEQRAWQDYLHACPAEVLRATGLAWTPVADGVAVCCNATQAPVVNRAFAFGLDRDATESDVDAALAFFAAHRAHGAVHVGPAARPAALRTWLEARGLRLIGKRVQLLRDTATPLPPVSCDLVIEEIGARDAAQFGATCMQGFGLPAIIAPSVAALVGRPGWRCFAARDGEAVVGTGALHLQGEVAFMGFAATLPPFRGRGVQSALLKARVQTAAAAGCTRVVTQTGEDTPEHPNPSLRNMRRLGFTEVHWASLFAAAP